MGANLINDKLRNQQHYELYRNDSIYYMCAIYYPEYICNGALYKEKGKTQRESLGSLSCD